MEGFDFGVSLSLYLSVGSLLLCVGYGLYYWNKDGEVGDSKKARQWEEEEQKINEEM